MRRPLPHPRPSERGAALLVAILSIAVLTVLALDLAYETQVRLRVAANARDELRAQALAQSAVNVSRLVLAFQNQIDQNLSRLCSPQAGSGTAQGTPTTAACPRPQLWSLIPVSNALTQSLFGDAPAAEGAARPGPGGDEKGAAPAVPAASFGDFEGGFEARIEDEAQKVNVQLDGLLQTSTRLAPQVEAILRMICDTRWDPLFDRTDADGQRYSRTDLLIHLRDWADDDTSGSVLGVSFPGGNCSFVVPAHPFERGFSDENAPYDRGAERYKAKNARLDSVDELHLVAGVSDAFMAAFGDQLTVYLPIDAGMNVNSDELAQQLRIAALMADPDSRVKLLDPQFAQSFHKALSDARMGGFVTITPVQFAQLLGAQGVTVRPEYLTQTPQNPFTDRSMVFRIRALGVAGDVTHETEAVVSYDPNLIPAEERAAASTAATQLQLGRLIRWREE